MECSSISNATISSETWENPEKRATRYPMEECLNMWPLETCLARASSGVDGLWHVGLCKLPLSQCLPYCFCHPEATITISGTWKSLTITQRTEKSSSRLYFNSLPIKHHFCCKKNSLFQKCGSYTEKSFLSSTLIPQLSSLLNAYVILTNSSNQLSIGTFIQGRKLRVQSTLSVTDLCCGCFSLCT